MIAQCENHLGRFADAATVCTEGRRHYPEEAELLFQEGTAYRYLGDLDGAIGCWQRVLKTPPGPHFASVNTGLRGYLTRHNLATAYMERGDLDEAEGTWHAALDEQPDYVPALTGLAELAVKGQQWERLDEITRNLQRAGAALEAAVFRARGHLGRGEYALAGDILVATNAAHPHAIWPRVVLSHVLLQEGRDWAGAERALRDVLRLDPNHKEARHNLDLLLRRGQVA